MRKQYMLRKNKEFRYVYRKGKNLAGKLLILIAAPNRQGPKVGFSVGKKVGKAVVRNRQKRRLRAAFFPLLPRLKPNVSYLFIARTPCAGKNYQELEHQMHELLKKGGYLDG